MRRRHQNYVVTARQADRWARVMLKRSKGWHLRWQLEGDGWRLALGGLGFVKSRVLFDGWATVNVYTGGPK